MAEYLGLHFGGQSWRPNSEKTSKDYCFGLNDNFENQILNGF